MKFLNDVKAYYWINNYISMDVFWFLKRPSVAVGIKIRMVTLVGLKLERSIVAAETEGVRSAEKLSHHDPSVAVFQNSNYNTPVYNLP